VKEFTATIPMRKRFLDEYTIIIPESKRNSMEKNILDVTPRRE
jgi:hypothetical protein